MPFSLYRTSTGSRSATEPPTHNPRRGSSGSEGTSPPRSDRTVLPRTSSTNCATAEVSGKTKTLEEKEMETFNTLKKRTETVISLAENTYGPNYQPVKTMRSFVKRAEETLHTDVESALDQAKYAVKYADAVAGLPSLTQRT